MPLILNGSTGVSAVQDDAVNPVTDIASGIPCFSAYLGTIQSVTSGVLTKIQYNIVEFDTTNAYDETTNYRFQPSVAGYYKVIVSLVAGVVSTQLNAAVYKNGALYKQKVLAANSNSASTSEAVEAIVYLNGTTDYIEGYGVVAGTTPTISTSVDRTYFQAHLIVGA